MKTPWSKPRRARRSAIKDIAIVEQGPKIRLGQISKTYKPFTVDKNGDKHYEDGKLIDNPDVVEGAVLLHKGADADPALKGVEAKVKELNDYILPKGVTVVPFLDRSDLIHLTTHTVLHNLTEGIVLVVIILMLFLGNVRGAIIVALTIPFALLFASICLSLKGIPANLLSLGALDFGMVVDGAVVMVENIVRHLNRPNHTDQTPMDKIREAAHEVQRPVFYAIGIIITAYLPIFTLQAVEGRLFKPMAWTVAFALLGALTLLDDRCAGDGQLLLPQGRKGVAQPGDGVSGRPLPQGCDLGHSSSRGYRLELAWLDLLMAVYLLERRHWFGVSASPG